MKTETLDLKRIFIFLGFAFGIAWAVALVIYLNGGLSWPVAGTLLAVVYMGAPALANVFTRLITHEGWRNTWLRPNLRRGWPFWLIAWFAPAVFIVLGMVIYFLLFPQHYDPTLGALTQLLKQQTAAYGVPAPDISPWIILLLQGGQALLIAPVINALFTFGEEFGWRAYLLQKLLPLGGRKAVVVLGVIWGVWHFPLTAMGHNYGLEYAGAPWLGFAAMTWFTFVLGTIMAWTVLKARSVWPAVIIHGAGNGTAAIALFFAQGNPNPVLGPSIAGVIGSLGIAVVALIIFFSRDGLTAAPEPPAAVPTVVEVSPAL